MEWQKVRQHVTNALTIVGWIFLGIAWLVLAGGGLHTLLHSGARGPLVGAISVIVAAVLAFLTVDRWIKILPALLVYGAANGVRMIASGEVGRMSGIPLKAATLRNSHLTRPGLERRAASA